MKKTIITISFIFALISNLFAATNFGSGPALFARAFERVDKAHYNVYGDGLKQGFSQEVQYSVAGVRNSGELMSLLQFNFSLSFDNYKSNVTEHVDIVASDGTQLFVSYNVWKPEEVLSQDGKNLSYKLPGQAGWIYLQLADQRVAFDGDSAQVLLESGYVLDLYPDNGFLTVPGWIFEQKGAFVVWKNGVKTVTDIQTGKSVNPEVQMLQTRTNGVSGLQVVPVTGMTANLNYLSLNNEYNPTCEITVPQDGLFQLTIKDWYGNLPEGMSVTTVGLRAEPMYVHPNKSGYCSVMVKKGQTLHWKFRWAVQSPKG